MIGACAGRPFQGTIDLAAEAAARARRSRVDLAQERCARGDRHAGGVRGRRQGDPRPPDGDLRRLRILRDAGAGRLHRAAAEPIRRLRLVGVRGRRRRRARNVVLTERLARCRRHGRGRVRDPLLGGGQRLLRCGGDVGAAHVRPARDDPGTGLGHPGAPGRLGARRPGGDLRARAALACTAACHAPS